MRDNHGKRPTETDKDRHDFGFVGLAKLASGAALGHQDRQTDKNDKVAPKMTKVLAASE